MAAFPLLCGWLRTSDRMVCHLPLDYGRAFPNSQGARDRKPEQEAGCHEEYW